MRVNSRRHASWLGAEYSSYGWVMYSRPSACACSIYGARVVVRPMLVVCSARRPAMDVPSSPYAVRPPTASNLLPFVPPGRDAASLACHLDLLRRTRGE